MTKFIHLLYVPTMNCNMQCKYCYLKENTTDLKQDDMYLKTLKYAVAKFKQADIVPFNISLHGGEVTTLSQKDFHDLIEYIYNYYQTNKDIITQNGFKLGTPHIKTNLLNIQKHLDTIKKFNVSISGSLDLPLSMHDKYRLTKGGGKTLKTILDNIKLLETIPNKKKVSATIFQEHFQKIDEIIKDIKYLDQNTCLDMNDFNFMIGFKTKDSPLTPLTEKNQVKFYQKMRKAFLNTNLDYGVRYKWFAEFTPAYCTNCDNCGEKFFLLERNGDIYSCVRGQKNKAFYYGNIYKDSVQTIMNNAKTKIYQIHNKLGFNRECASCQYLYLCKTGCPYVKKLYHQNKSYTCALQKQIYKDNEEYPKDINNDEDVYLYLNKNHPELASKYYPKNQSQNSDIPSLETIINQDKKLKDIYSSDIFLLQIDDKTYKLQSQILKKQRDIVYITDKSKITLYIKKGVLENTDYPVNNSLYIMLLSGQLVVYGDEQRPKQRHIMTHQIYKDIVTKHQSDKPNYYQINITNLLKMYQDDYSKDKPNNLFFTTNALRDYHYLKQKNNAYYHIHAMNLPFQNIEFYYIKEDQS